MDQTCVQKQPAGSLSPKEHARVAPTYLAVPDVMPRRTAERESSLWALVPPVVEKANGDTLHPSTLMGPCERCASGPCRFIVGLAYRS